MKIIQINVWHNKLLPRVIDLINQEQPDVICVQELLDTERDLVFNDFYFAGSKLIKENTELSNSFFSPYLSFEVAGAEVFQGNAIFSKTPFVSQSTTFTRGALAKKYKVSQGKRPGVYNLQLVTINNDDKMFTIANHHGYYLTNPIGDDTTAHDMQLVKDKLSQTETPLVFCGDLNVTSRSPAMRVFDGFLTDLTEKYNVNNTLSSMHDIDGIACDHILVSDDIKVENFIVIEQVVSDHKALVLDCS